jgi:hypothetical protein
LLTTFNCQSLLTSFGSLIARQVSEKSLLTGDPNTKTEDIQDIKETVAAAS